MKFFVRLIEFWLPATMYQLVGLCFPAFPKAHKHQPSSHQRLRRSQNRALYPLCLLRYSGRYRSPDRCRLRRQLLSRLHCLPLLPTPREVMRHFIHGNFAREVLAYYVHRILHRLRFYSHYHRLHLSFLAPIAFTGLYTAPVEHFLLTLWQLCFHSP